MKTVFIAFTLKNSSVAEFFVTLSNFLAKDYNVIIFSHANEISDFTLSNTVVVLKWPSKRPTSFRDLRFLIKQINKYQPDTIIANFAAVNVFMLGGFLMKVKNRIAWYHTLTTQLNYKPLLRFRKKFFYAMATRIVTNSQAAKLDLVNAFKVHPKRVEIVNNAVKDPNFNNITNPNKIVYAGRLHQIKGIEVLVRAMAIVKEKFEDVSLVVVGDDEKTGELQKLKNIQKKFSLEDNIIFKGNRSRDYVLKQFSTAYCTIVPSYFEAFGYVVIESFSVRTPVIGSDTTGIATILRDGKDGFLFKPGNHLELAENIIELLGNEDLRERMAENCYKRFTEEYELNKVTKNFAKNPAIFN